MTEQNGGRSSWTSVRLGDVVEPRETRNPTKEGPGEFLYVDIEALDNRSQRIVSSKRIANKSAPSRARMALRTGDVVFSLVRPYLKNIAIVPRELDGGVASTAYCVLRPKEGVDARFLFYQLIQDGLINSVPTYGTSPPAARDEEFLNTAIRITKGAEQTRVADKLDQLFSDLDAGVAALERAKANLARYRAAVLKAAVEGKLTEQWRREHPDLEPASVLLAQVLDARRECRRPGAKQRPVFAPDPPPNWDLPTGWTWATVDQVSSEVAYGSSAKARKDAHGVPVLRMGNIVDGDLDLASLKYLPGNHKEFPALLLRDGDVLFNRTNSAELVGKAAVYRGLPQPCSFASYLIRVRLLSGVIPRYLCHALNSNFGRRWIRDVVSQQVGQANVNGTKLKSFTFPLPSCAEQEAIVEQTEWILSTAVSTTTACGLALARSAALRNGVLAKAFSGELV